MIEINGKQYKELRCARCQKFIIYHSIAMGIVFIQCSRCGFANEFVFKYLKSKENKDIIEKKFIIEEVI